MSLCDPFNLAFVTLGCGPHKGCMWVCMDSRLWLPEGRHRRCTCMLHSHACSLWQVLLPSAA